MNRPARIWVILLIVAMVTTVSSAIVWNTYTRPGTASEIQSTMSAYDTMKMLLTDVKGSSTFLTPRTADVAGERIVTFYDGANIPIIVEYHVNRDTVSAIHYDLGHDGLMDIFEFYDSGGRKIVRTEYDTDQDGSIEVVEKDLNDNSIIETEELYLNLEGRFIPFSGFGNIIM